MARLQLRLMFDTVQMGPGKAELMEHIRETGSISAAGRRMDMSYKRAWTLIEELNTAFAQPLVQSSRGGAGGGGAQLTEAGAEVLRLFRQIEAELAQVAAPHVGALEALLRPAGDIPERK